MIMKNLFKNSTLVTLLVAIFVISTGFTRLSTSKMVSSEDPSSCTLTVMYSDGTEAGGMTVTTELTSKTGTIKGAEFYTDDEGFVVLEWASKYTLSKVYVDGQAYEVNYEDGGDYTLTLKDTDVEMEDYSRN